MKTHSLLAAIFVGLSCLWIVDPVQAIERGLTRVGQDQDPKRIALVIGNQKYRYSPLDNPINDVRGIADALSAVGFEVVKLENAVKKSMRHAVQTFSDRLRATKGVGLFYFAGHGMQAGGENYLFPIGGNITHYSQIKSQLINLNWIIEELHHAENRMNIIVIDACRDNPIANKLKSRSKSRSVRAGLTEVRADSGTLIAFSTSPGKMALDGNTSTANSVYTKHLITNLQRPGLIIEKVFKEVRKQVKIETGGDQVPWEHSSLTEDFYFVPDFATASVEAHNHPAPGERDVQMEMWKNAQRANDPELYKTYLTYFPNGVYARLAHLFLKRLQTSQIDRPASHTEQNQTVPVNLSQQPPNTSIWMQRARNALIEDRLTTPTHDNAVLWSEMILHQDQDNLEAKALLESVVNRYLNLGRHHLSQGRAAQAYKNFTHAAALDRYANDTQITEIAVLSDQAARAARAQRSHSNAGTKAQQNAAGQRQSTPAETMHGLGALIGGAAALIQAIK